ncbi:MAG TPA: ABC transporter ATP-binding protein, partial [Chloroflexia bacterium]|nr:ABC transporter ATP-binding protein [Chloroflexia bacterium]
AILAVLLGGSIILQLMNPQVLRAFIDATATPGATSRLPGLAALFIALALAQQGLSVGATWASEQLAWTATNALRADLTLHCLRLDLTFHKTRTPGELIERIDGDVTAMANFFSKFVVQILGSVLLLTGVLVVLWTVDPRAGIALTVFGLLTLAAMISLRVLAVPYWTAARQASAELFGFLEERLAGTVDIRANGAQGYVLYRLAGYLRRRLQTGRKARIVGSVGWFVPVLAFAIGQALAFALAAWLFREGTITLGTAFLIYYYTQLLFQPLDMISHQIEDFQKATAGISRVQELMQIRSALPEGAGLPLPSGPLAVDFADVVFAYEDDPAVVQALSFRLAPGEIVGLLGRTGSGKTTLTRLLLRLYDPLAGSIRLGGVDLRDADRAALRAGIGMVTQDVQLFRASVRDNLTFFDRTIHDARIWTALETLGLGPWAHGLANGLDTMLAAGGGGLSAGEAQLLAFTRVFLKDPGLVILDEASSRLDPATERLIEQAIGTLLHGRTGIIIAHRLATVERADTVLILEDGGIGEIGARARLAADPRSRFAELLRTGAAEVLA